MSDWYQVHLVDTGRSAALWLLIGFVLTYAITRWITVRIHARAVLPSGDGGTAVKDVYIGGVHIHHQVWGILLVLVVGLLEFRFSPQPPWREVLAALFGAGAALALDEFALWLHLQDVYWTAEGRKSIDAVLVASVVGVALLVGTSPIGVDPRETTGLVATSILVLFHFAYTIVCLLKGKLATGLIGFTLPVVALVGSIRLAKPSSFWAKRFYRQAKAARSEARFDARYRARQDRLRDIFSGGHRRQDPPVSTSAGYTPR
jgi:hypothetical protein